PGGRGAGVSGGGLMDRLFRPWRMAYVSAPKTEACFLCEAVMSEDDASHLVVARGSYGLVILNRYPYNSGHVMIVPLRHVADLADLRSEERLGILDLLVETLAVLASEFTPDGSNVGITLGRTAGTGVRDYVHVHV